MGREIKRGKSANRWSEKEGIGRRQKNEEDGNKQENWRGKTDNNEEMGSNLPVKGERNKRMKRKWKNIKGARKKE